MYSFTQQQAVESFVTAKIDQSTQKLREEIKNLIKTELQQTAKSGGDPSQNSTKATANQATSGQSSTSQIPQPPMLFNYLIDGPEEEDPKSAIAAEINLDSPNLYVLGLQNQELKWVAGGGGGDASHPFKVITKTIDGDLYWGILEKSYAWTSMAPADQGEISGRLTTGNDNDPNWIQINQTTGSSDYIYLEYDQDNVETKIASVFSASTFDPSINNVENSNNWLVIELNGAVANFKFARKIIARADTTISGTTITQFVRNHQLLQDICYNGNPARYWFDFSKGNKAP